MTTWTDSLAESIGLDGYATATKGIGGVLKARVTDFRVEEISTAVHLDNKGRFTVAKIMLTNWETNRFCNTLAKALSIPRNRIFFAGTKDKRAVTQQLFVIDAPKAKVAAVEIPDVEIEVIGRTHQKIGFGNHRGNRFTIVVRGCANEDGSPMSVEDALEQVNLIQEEMASKLGENKFPNWIGPQRFGSGRPVTAEVGRHVIAGDWKQAALTYIAMEGESENEDVAAFRAHVRENGPTEEGLELAPRWLGFERKMVEHLLHRPDDYIGAFRKLPGNLQLMTVHALQSVVFNKSLHARLAAKHPISWPVAGDMVGRIDEKGQLDASSCVVVEERTLPRIIRNCELGRLSPTGPLPGTEIKTCEGKSGDIEKQVINTMGLTDMDWKVEAIPRLSTRGTRRSLVTSFNELSVDNVPLADDESMGERWKSGPTENSRWHPEGACIRFRFTLASGSYATTLLREFMRCPLHQL
ncbi:MAG: tRNA pseudouridine(13) synthase TruD [Candidatus Poseidoniaceae archaeon]|nr:tRNA pseudouridine(13) synthase TruD [Candidatus Poseidoniaceae archaeon]